MNCQSLINDEPPTDHMDQSSLSIINHRFIYPPINHADGSRRVTVIALLDGTNNHVRELVFFANLSHLDRVGPCIDFTHQVEWMKKGVVVGRRSNFQGLLLHLESASTV